MWDCLVKAFTLHAYYFLLLISTSIRWLIMIFHLNNTWLNQSRLIFCVQKFLQWGTVWRRWGGERVGREESGMLIQDEFTLCGWYIDSLGRRSEGSLGRNSEGSLGRNSEGSLGRNSEGRWSNAFLSVPWWHCIVNALIVELQGIVGLGGLEQIHKKFN